MKRCVGAVRVALAEQAATTLRNHSVDVVADRLDRREVGDRRRRGSCAVFVRSLHAERDERVLGEALRAPRTSGSRRSLNATRARAAAGVPTSSASARSGAAVAQRARRPGAARGTAPRVLARNGRCVREARDRRVERGRAAADRRPAGTGARRWRARANVVSRLREQLGLRLGRPARRSRGGPPERLDEAARAACAGPTRFCMTGTRLRSSGLSASIARLRSGAAAGERVAELVEVALRRPRASGRRRC